MGLSAIYKVFMKFIFITKTNWDEPPRIRHQLAEALLRHGHEVVFFEKSVSLLSKRKSKVCSDSFRVLTPHELTHHRLRIKVVMYFECLFQVYQYKKYTIQQGFKDTDIIINFSYDSYFLRKVFPNNRIITILNDDFEMQTKLFGYSVGRNSLINTIKMSDFCLSTSPILAQRYQKYNNKSEAFLPWYQGRENKSKNIDRDKNNQDKKAILIWAYITERIDFDIIELLLINRTISIEVFGPIHHRVKGKVDSLTKSFDNIRFFPACKLEELQTEKYFCSLTPYLNQEQNEKIYVTNKLFQLASFGMLSINLGLPNFIELPGVFNCVSFEEVLTAVDDCIEDGHALSSKLIESIADNTEQARVNQLDKIIKGI